MWDLLTNTEWHTFEQHKFSQKILFICTPVSFMMIYVYQGKFSCKSTLIKIKNQEFKQNISKNKLLVLKDHKTAAWLHEKHIWNYQFSKYT